MSKIFTFILFSFVIYVQAEENYSTGKLYSSEESLSIQKEEDARSSHPFYKADEKPFEAKESNGSFFDADNSFEVFWNGNYGLKNFTSDGANESLIKVELLGQLKWQLIDSLFVHTKTLIIGRSGHTQSVLDRTDRSSGFYVLEFYFNWKAFPNISVLHGIIEQGFLSAPLLITDKAFPSLMGEWSINSLSNFDLKVLLQIAIANNFTEQAKRPSDIQRAPLFLTSSVFLDSDDFFNTYIKEKFTFFHYYNLPSDIAQRSSVYGNDITGLGSSAVFKHSFLGFHNNLSFQKVLSDLWALSAGFEFIYNFLSPNTFNEGFRVYSSIYHNYRETMEVKLTGELFANQSDTSVAYYNSEIYGHNNRKGILAKLESHFFRSGLTLETSFVYSQPIVVEKSSIQEAYSFAVVLKTNNIAI